MIIDAHFHVWRFHSERYSWQPLTTITPTFEWPIEKQIGVMDQYDIDKGILVQPSIYGFDNSYILDCGRRYPERLRLIGLTDPRAESVEFHVESLAEQGVRGLRLAPRTRPDIPWYNESRADRVWNKAEQLDMALTLLITLTDIAPVAEAIKRFPRVKAIIDHLARPDAVDDPDGRLFENLLTLAQFDHVYLKLSALGFISQEPYPHDDILVLVRRVFDIFGPDRLMWGTDIPISQDPATVRDTMHLIELALPDVSVEDRAKIMGGTAAKVFGWVNSNSK